MPSTLNQPLNRKLRMALVGGSGGGFIGRVHAIAATLDQRAELVAGAFSSSAEKSIRAAVDFGVAAERGYGSCRELIESLVREAEEILESLDGKIRTKGNGHGNSLGRTGR